MGEVYKVVGGDYDESCVFFLYEPKPVLVGLFVKTLAPEVVGPSVGSPDLFMHHINIDISAHPFVGGVLRLRLFTRIAG